MYRGNNYTKNWLKGFKWAMFLSFICSDKMILVAYNKSQYKIINNTVQITMEL